MSKMRLEGLVGRAEKETRDPVPGGGGGGELSYERGGDARQKF